MVEVTDKDETEMEAEKVPAVVTSTTVITAA